MCGPGPSLSTVPGVRGGGRALLPARRSRPPWPGRRSSPTSIVPSLARGLVRRSQDERASGTPRVVAPRWRPQLLHLLLADEGRVPESVVVETYDVADRPLFVRDRSLDRLAVARELEVRFLLRREAARDFPALVPLPERHTDVTVRPTHVRELHALNVRPRRLAVQ